VITIYFLQNYRIRLIEFTKQQLIVRFNLLNIFRAAHLFFDPTPISIATSSLSTVYFSIAVNNRISSRAANLELRREKLSFPIA
jgi:hypothetical protein